MFASDTIRGSEKTMPQEEMDRLLNVKIQKDIMEKILGLNAAKLLRSVGVEI